MNIDERIHDVLLEHSCDIDELDFDEAKKKIKQIITDVLDEVTLDDIGVDGIQLIPPGSNGDYSRYIAGRDSARAEFQVKRKGLGL